VKYNQLTKDQVNETLTKKDITLVGDYLGARVITSFACNNGHIWSASPSNVLHKSGCPKCSGRAPLTRGEINSRIIGRHLRMIGEFTQTTEKTLFECRVCSYNWLATPGNIMSGKGCRKCASYGFNPSKPAYGYILLFKTYIKYGITNNLPSRLSRHILKNGNHDLVNKLYFEQGEQALLWENKIKTELGGRFVSKDVCPDGFTETLSIDTLPYINEHYINKYVP